MRVHEQIIKYFNGKIIGSFLFVEADLLNEEDAISEGLVPDVGGIPFKAKTKFFQLWESVYGEESIEQKPFVWVYEFKQVEKP